MTKTEISAAPDCMDLHITREFELPVELLYLAYSEAGLIAQWMGTEVLKLEHQPHGGFRFKTPTPDGGALYFNGVIHKVNPNQSIVRTFEMEGMPIGVQLDFIHFNALSPETSRLSIHSIYESVAQRDFQLSMPFAYGLNMAHDRLQQIAQINPS